MKSILSGFNQHYHHQLNHHWDHGMDMTSFPFQSDFQIRFPHERATPHTLFSNLLRSTTSSCFFLLRSFVCGRRHTSCMHAQSWHDKWINGQGRCTQGNHTDDTHKGDLGYAFDFKLRPGTKACTDVRSVRTICLLFDSMILLSCFEQNKIVELET